MATGDSAPVFAKDMKRCEAPWPDSAVALAIEVEAAPTAASCSNKVLLVSVSLISDKVRLKTRNVIGEFGRCRFGS